jgi:hypothetical protein
MRDCAAMFNRSGEHVAAIRFNESCGVWQSGCGGRRNQGFSVAVERLHSLRGPTRRAENRIAALDNG